MIKYSKSKHFTFSLSCKYTYETHELVLRARLLIKLLFYHRKFIFTSNCAIYTNKESHARHLRRFKRKKKDLQFAGLPKSFKKMIILSKIR